MICWIINCPVAFYVVMSVFGESNTIFHHRILFYSIPPSSSDKNAATTLLSLLSSSVVSVGSLLQSLLSTQLKRG